MTSHLDSLSSFIQASPSSFHAVAEVARQLVAGGFTELHETDEWPDRRARSSSSGSVAHSFFVVRDGAIVAWRTPSSAGPTTPFRIVGSHTDSPGFKLKPQPTTGAFGWLQAGVEVYGGPLFNSWLDRELEFAGRLAFRDGTTALVRTGALLRFPQLAVHLDRGVNSEGLKLDPQRHLNPVIGLGDVDQADLVGHLARLAGQTGAEVAGYDISVADTQPPAVFGLDDAFFASGRLDNLSSVHSSLVAFLASGAVGESDASGQVGVSGRSGNSGSSDSSSSHEGRGSQSDSGAIQVLVAFDHEEVGSETRSGASGPFLADILTRISAGLGASESDRLRAFAGSWCLSADAGHAVHPNYPEKHDPVNRPVAGRGPLLKINANQRYATDALGAAEWSRACEEAGVEYQEFVSNNAVPCGSTIGPLTATRLGIRTIDVGLPLLSMHSARELAGAADPEKFSSAIGAFLVGAN